MLSVFQLQLALLIRPFNKLRNNNIDTNWNQDWKYDFWMNLFVGMSSIGVYVQNTVYGTKQKENEKKVRKCVTFTEQKQTSSFIQKDAGNICYGNLIWNYWCGCMTVGLIWRRRCSYTFTWVILVKFKKRESQTKCQTSKQYELIANLKQIFFLNFRIHIYEPTTKINEKERERVEGR